MISKTMQKKSIKDRKEEMSRVAKARWAKATHKQRLDQGQKLAKARKDKRLINKGQNA